VLVFYEEMLDIQMEDEPPIKRLSTLSSRNPTRWESNEETAVSDDNMALDEELFTASERYPSRIGSSDSALQSSSLRTVTGDTTKYRTTYSYGAREMAVNHRFPNRSADSSDSDTLIGNSPQLSNISRFSNPGITSIEPHIPETKDFCAARIRVRSCQ